MSRAPEDTCMRTTTALRCTLVAAILAGAACGGTSPVTPGDDTPGDDTPTDEWDQRLTERVLDYNAALRTAALRLTGGLPSLAEIKAVADAGDDAAKKVVYESLLRSYLEGPRFARQMVAFWRDTMRLGGGAMDSAPAFAAQLAVENRPYTELLTAATGTCPTFDAAAGTFTPADCANGVPTAAGVLSNPAVMAQFSSNLAFRRVRWVQEVFACTAFPVELTGTPPEGGAPAFLSVWPMESIAGLSNGGTIDFHDQSAVICANCHTTMNHLAPLFANFDDNGQLQADIQVKTPQVGNPLALRSDWLPGAEPTAWRYGVPAADLPALGAAMAADPDIAECAVARLWNWALGKGDIVDALATVPPATIAAQVADFQANGGKLKDAIFAVYTSDDFVRF
ncbi:MAG: DUF1588 domain-containing protein [Kofleriaceae bacterium]